MSPLIALTLLVRLADTVGVPSPVVGSAQREATAILRDAGVEPRWLVCAREGVPACHKSLESGELVVRLAHQGAGQSGGVLGTAVVDTSRRSGTLATVWVDTVTVLAARAGINRGRLMGRAVAHEIGHLVLGTTQHADTGLMRALWSLATLRRNDWPDWTFAEQEKRELVRNVAARKTSTTTVVEGRSVAPPSSESLPAQ